MKSFYIRSKLIDNTAVIYPKGHLDAHNVERFEKEILRLINNNVIQRYLIQTAPKNENQM